MTTYSEQQWNARRMLLCAGSREGTQHIAPLPHVRNTYGVTGDLRCEECGEPMALVDVLTIERAATLAQLDYMREAPLYTTAKLHPMAMLSAIAKAESA